MNKPRKVTGLSGHKLQHLRGGGDDQPPSIKNGSERHLAGLERKSRAGRQAFGGSRSRSRPSRLPPQPLGARLGSRVARPRSGLEGGGGTLAFLSPKPAPTTGTTSPQSTQASGDTVPFLTSPQGRRKTATGARNPAAPAAFRTQEWPNPAAPHFTGFPAGGSRVRRRGESRSGFRAT